MAYAFSSGSAQYLSAPSPISTRPATFSIWYRQPSGANGTMMSVNDVVDSHRLLLRMASSRVTADDITSLTGTATSTTNSTAGTPFNAVGVFKSEASRTVYRNAGASQTNTTSVGTANAYSDLAIGAAYNGSWGAYWIANGELSECAIWSAELTLAEIESLAKGFKPTRIRPQSLVFYAPLIRDLKDWRGALTITNNNTATVANHPRVY